MLSLLLILVLSYLVGSIPSSVWIGKALHGVDVRDHGSRNAGATNAFRVLGWRTGLLSTLIDMGKGFLAAGLIAGLRVDALPFGLGTAGDGETIMQLLAGVAAVAGHMFPFWVRFKGGKGVNTAAGALFAISPLTMGLTLAIFAVVLLSSHYVSLASITASASFPTIVAVRRYGFDAESQSLSLLVFGVILAAAIIWAHRANIRRLVNGNENRVRSFRPARGMLGRGELRSSKG